MFGVVFAALAVAMGFIGFQDLSAPADSLERKLGPILLVFCGLSTACALLVALGVVPQ